MSIKSLRGLTRRVDLEFNRAPVQLGTKPFLWRLGMFLARCNGVIPLGMLLF